MASTSLARTLFVRWYVTAAGLLMTLVLSALAFSLVPTQYVSSGTAVLVPPRQGGNPMLKFDSSLNTTALILVQSLNSPAVKAQAVLPGTGTYTVRNGGSVDLRDDGTGRPFITVTAQSTVAAQSTSMVFQVLDLAKQQLYDRQDSLHVNRRLYMELETVVDAAPPVPMLTAQLKAVGIVFLLGLVSTVVVVCMYDKRVGKRGAQEPSVSMELSNGFDVWPSDVRMRRHVQSTTIPPGSFSEAPSALVSGERDDGASTNLGRVI